MPLRLERESPWMPRRHVRDGEREFKRSMTTPTGARCWSERASAPSPSTERITSAKIMPRIAWRSRPLIGWSGSIDRSLTTFVSISPPLPYLDRSEERSSHKEQGRSECPRSRQQPQPKVSKNEQETRATSPKPGRDEETVCSARACGGASSLLLEARGTLRRTHCSSTAPLPFVLCCPFLCPPTKSPHQPRAPSNQDAARAGGNDET